MISRYNRPKIEKIWTLENKFKIWTDIEILIAEKLSDIGVIPKIAAKEIRKKAKFSVREIHKLERKTKHDVNAVVQYLSKKIEKNISGALVPWVHFGLTSEDINNTAYSLMIKGAVRSSLLKSLKELSGALKKLASQNHLWQEFCTQPGF